MSKKPATRYGPGYVATYTVIAADGTDQPTGDDVTRYAEAEAWRRRVEAGLEDAPHDLDYHEHDHLTENTYEEHAHAGNTAGHTHPEQDLGPRIDQETPA